MVNRTDIYLFLLNNKNDWHSKTDIKCATGAHYDTVTSALNRLDLQGLLEEKNNGSLFGVRYRLK